MKNKITGIVVAVLAVTGIAAIIYAIDKSSKCPCCCIPEEDDDYEDEFEEDLDGEDKEV